MHRLTTIIAAGALVLAAACSSDSTTTTGTTDDTTITADLAPVLADGVADDVDLMAGMDGGVGNIAGAPGVFASLSGPGKWRPHLTGCTFADGSFTCPATRANGLTVTRTITFLDGNGQPMDAYDSLLTASIHVVAEISGDKTHGPWSATVDRHRDFTITGLLGTETTRTVNGTGNGTVSRSRSTANARSYDLTCSSTITNVVFPVRSDDGGNGWPESGTISRTCTITVTAGPNAGKTITRTVVITFDGPSTPSGTIDGTPFMFDLTARSAAKR
ncbi:MAG: hypothetical protein ACREL5_01990 [Gemmatimonadales bacterium]